MDTSLQTLMKNDKIAQYITEKEVNNIETLHKCKRTKRKEGEEKATVEAIMVDVVDESVQQNQFSRSQSHGKI